MLVENAQKNYVEQVETELEDLAGKIVQLREAALQAGPHEKLELYDQLEDARIKESGALTKLATLKEANPDSWEEKKTTLETGLQALRNSLASSSTDTHSDSQ